MNLDMMNSESKKFMIQDNQWIWNKNLPTEEWYDTNDYQTLKARGQYLTEIVDKEFASSTSNDIQNLPKGRLIINWGPSAGKTTAIRQFIVNSIINNDIETGIFATRKIEDVDAIYFDIVSQCLYKKNLRAGFGAVRKFHSKTEIEDVTTLRLSAWLICTHERLMIEPPSMILLNDIGAMISFDLSRIYRSYLIIDEYPSSLFKSVYIKDVTLALETIRAKANISPDDDTFTKNLKIIKTLNNAIDKGSTNNPALPSLIDALPCTTNHSYKVDVCRGWNSSKSVASRNRISFFTSLFLERYDEYMSRKYEDMEGDKAKIYYSILDLTCTNVYIFDGTGDILFHGNKNFKIIEDDRFKRNLNLNSINVLKNNINRKMSSEEIAEEFANMINTASSTHEGKRILAYTWMDSKKEDDNDKLIELLKSKLDNPELVDIIHYNSGKERVTSEYSKDSILMILGKFFIPNSYVAELRNVIGSDITTKDYTLSLLVQATYRTSARKGKPIDIYFTDDYPDMLIEDFLSKFNISNTSNTNINHLEDEFKKSERRSELLTKILDSGKGEFIDNYYLIINKDLAEVLNHKLVDNRHISKHLDMHNIKYELLKGISRTNPSKFKIYLTN